MKKIFSIFLVCCATFAFANDEPYFEETDEDARVGAYQAFSAEDPIFEEDDSPDAEGQNECDGTEQDPSNEGEETPGLLNRLARTPRFEDKGEDHDRFASYANWQRYRANFGIEKIFVRFPQKPAISQSNTLLTAFAYDHAVLYSVTGYYPPMGNISPIAWFDDILYSVNQHPYTLLSHPATFQATNGDWVMDYTLHDYVQNLVIKARAICTPFNGYTLQCVKPNGARDYFDYFVDNFWIKCECND